MVVALRERHDGIVNEVNQSRELGQAEVRPISDWTLSPLIFKGCAGVADLSTRPIQMADNGEIEAQACPQNLIRQLLNKNTSA